MASIDQLTNQVGRSRQRFELHSAIATTHLALSREKLRVTMWTCILVERASIERLNEVVHEVL